MRKTLDGHQRRSAADSELMLMALSTGTLAARRANQPLIEAVARDVDADVLAAELGRFRLLPTLGPRLVETLGDGVARFAAAVESAMAECRRQDTLLTLISERILDTLAAAGIRGAALKGPRLGESIYGEAGRRLSGDIDLLVAPADLGRATEAILALGYGASRDSIDDDGLPVLHLSFQHREEALPPVELHWRIHWYETRFAVERLLPPEPVGPGWRPEPPDELAALLLYFARDGFTGLRLAADLGAWWDRYGDRVEPGALGAVAAAYPSLAPALGASSTVAERRIGLPAALLLGGPARLGPRGRTAVRLADPRPYASEEQLFAEIGLIDGLLAPAGSFGAFFRRQISPSAEIVDAKRREAGGGRPLSRFGFSIRMLGRYGLALGRLAHLPLVERARFS